MFMASSMRLSEGVAKWTHLTLSLHLVSVRSARVKHYFVYRLSVHISRMRRYHKHSKDSDFPVTVELCS